jgi:DNA-directed RNA polymerase subunit P
LPETCLGNRTASVLKPMSEEETAKEEEAKTAGGIEYECASCAARVTAEQLAVTPEIKCPICGYRILKKVRPPIVRHVKAR